MHTEYDRPCFDDPNEVTPCSEGQVYEDDEKCSHLMKNGTWENCENGEISEMKLEMRIAALLAAAEDLRLSTEDIEGGILQEMMAHFTYDKFQSMLYKIRNGYYPKIGGE